MANQKISELPIVSYCSYDALFIIADNGRNYSMMAQDVMNTEEIAYMETYIAYLDESKQDLINENNKIEYSYINNAPDVNTLTYSDIDEICKINIE